MSARLGAHGFINSPFLFYFCFVWRACPIAQAKDAVEALNGTEYNGMVLVLRQVQSRPPRSKRNKGGNQQHNAGQGHNNGNNSHNRNSRAQHMGMGGGGGGPMVYYQPQYFMDPRMHMAQFQPDGAYGQVDMQGVMVGPGGQRHQGGAAGTDMMQADPNTHQMYAAPVPPGYVTIRVPVCAPESC